MTSGVRKLITSFESFVLAHVGNTVLNIWARHERLCDAPRLLPEIYTLVFLVAYIFNSNLILAHTTIAHGELGLSSDRPYTSRVAPVE
ncbi:hypothetical protein EI97DRAFT_108868 [Westerdykella ornata]|uniref:Uncharacterized protein n=1 Tax=Westerdykella ornata TaxID=318751 RepID=A0A6A6JW58_WESOR|nr:hypothetical protein EI97DRAFT_108868 [Westerdykella ornata]